MTYSGRIKGGVVVFDGDQKPDEGTLVKIETVTPSQASTVGERLLKWAGRLENLPSDSSANLDHYLYGHPKE